MVEKFSEIRLLIKFDPWQIPVSFELPFCSHVATCWHRCSGLHRQSWVPLQNCQHVQRLHCLHCLHCGCWNSFVERCTTLASLARRLRGAAIPLRLHRPGTGPRNTSFRWETENTKNEKNETKSKWKHPKWENDRKWNKCCCDKRKRKT